MNAKINVKQITSNGGYIDIKMKLENEDGTQLSDSRIDNVIITGSDTLTVTTEEIESELVNVKSHLYHGGEGMHPHQLYKMAVANIVARQVSSKWIIR